MVVRLRRLDVVQLGLVAGVLYAMLGLVEALLMWGVMSAVPRGSADGFGAAAAIFVMGPLMLVFFPIGGFVIGFIGGLVTALLYNLTALWTGGIGLTLSDVSSVSTPAVPQT